jgi:hypothetical protein
MSQDGDQSAITFALNQRRTWHSIPQYQNHRHFNPWCCILQVGWAIWQRTSTSASGSFDIESTWVKYRQQRWLVVQRPGVGVSEEAGGNRAELYRVERRQSALCRFGPLGEPGLRIDRDISLLLTLLDFLSSWKNLEPMNLSQIRTGKTWLVRGSINGIAPNLLVFHQNEYLYIHW